MSLQAEAEQRIREAIVGRRRELELILAMVRAGRDVVLLGPPGTSKTTLLRAITREWEIPLLLVEGSGELTPARLVGHHDPADVLRRGYSEDNFVAGPLVEAMRSGGFLYVEEINRTPEDTLNVLLGAMADREISVPRLGVVRALPTFRLVASMNPNDSIGTTRLSESITDRLCRLELGYQDAEAEERIVRLRRPAGESGPVADALAWDAVALTRATREDPDVRQGSSVRGAIDLALVGAELARARTVEAPGGDAYRNVVWDAMVLALSGRIHVDEASGMGVEALLRAIFERHFALEPG